MEGSKGFVITSEYSEQGPSVVIEDDGRVCYAYYYSTNGEIVGDVWLYNRCETPTIPEWTNKNQAPFANPFKYVRVNIPFELPNRTTDFEVRWLESVNGLQAQIFLRDMLVGVLAEGWKPGFALAAIKDGPLARALHTSDGII